jgi:hypothetical protein
MTFPNMSIDVIDPGIGRTIPAPSAPLFTGMAYGGSVADDTLAQINDINLVRSEVGYGPLAEDIALALQQSGGPIWYYKHSVTAPTASGDMTEVSGAGTGDIAMSGTIRDDYSLAVEVVASGVAGVGTFRYCLDYYPDDEIATWSRVRTIPAGLTFAVPNTGITLTFDVGPATYPAGALFHNALATAIPTTVELGEVLADIPTSFLSPLWSVSGLQIDENTASALATAFQGHLTTLTQTYRYMRGIIDIGSEDTAANILLETEDWTGVRIVPAYGAVVRASAAPYEGYGYRRCSTQAGIAARAVGSLISTDLARTADGPDEGVVSIEFDGYVEQTLDAAQISTMRTWPGIPGFYFSGAKLKCSFGSDYTDLQFGRIMDVACRTVFTSQFPFMGEAFRVVSANDATEEHPEGSIDPLEAADIDAAVTQGLADNLLRPNNARGRPGHVTEVEYTIDPLYNVVTTGIVKSEVGIVPLGYVKQIDSSLYFTLGG